MQTVEYLTREQLVHYGTLIGEAFVEENDGIVMTALKEDIVKVL